MTVTTATLDNGMRQISETIRINRPAEMLYSLWRGLTVLPQMMRHVLSVTTSGSRSHWVVKGPVGRKLEWDAEMTDVPEEKTIAWHTLPDADVRNAGQVSFKPTPDGDATEMTVLLSYDPPAGKAGVLVAHMFGEEPAQQMEEDLQHFKDTIEGSVVAEEILEDQ